MIEFIRQKCIEVNPEIVELKFGCFINDKYTMLLRCGGDFGNEIMQIVDTRTGEAGGYFASYIDDGNGDSRLETVEDWIKNGEIEIIGRDIRLADVLLAISHSEKNWHQEDFGCVSADLAEKSTSVELSTNEKGYAFWNLRQDNLNDQDDPTIKLIYDILK